MVSSDAIHRNKLLKHILLLSSAMSLKCNGRANKFRAVFWKIDEYLRHFLIYNPNMVFFSAVIPVALYKGSKTLKHQLSIERWSEKIKLEKCWDICKYRLCLHAYKRLLFLHISCSEAQSTKHYVLHLSIFQNLIDSSFYKF